MKKLISIIALLIALVPASQAQNALFVEFSNSYDQVLASMEARKYVQIESSEPGEELVVRAQGASYVYRFNQGWLYEVNMKRNFDSRREAKQAFKGCLEYFDLIRADQIAVVENDKLRKEQVFVRTGRVYRVQYKMLANGSLDVSLRTRYTANTPLTDWETYDYKAGYEIIQTLNQ